MKNPSMKGILLIALSLLISCCFYGDISFKPQPVADSIPELALNYAMHQVDKPYLWGGQGPDEFDCSGLIISAYENTIGSPLLLLNRHGEIVNDVNADELFRYNTVALSNDEIIPGDLVFITSSQDRVTHAGLFISWDENNTIQLINASSFHGKVCTAQWPLDGSKREQWIVGFGRLQIVKE